MSTRLRIAFEQYQSAWERADPYAMRFWRSVIHDVDELNTWEV